LSVKVLPYYFLSSHLSKVFKCSLTSTLKCIRFGKRLHHLHIQGNVEKSPTTIVLHRNPAANLCSWPKLCPHLAWVSAAGSTTAISTAGGSSRGLRMPSFSWTIHIGLGMKRADKE